MKLVRLVSLWTPVIAFMALIYALSAQSTLPAAEYVWDKALHAGAYGLFGMLCLRAFHGGLRPLRPLPVLAALAMTLLYAVLDELHQSRVPGRDPSALDWIADAVGAGLAVPLAGWLAARRAERRERPGPFG